MLMLVSNVYHTKQHVPLFTRQCLGLPHELVHCVYPRVG